MNVPRPRRPLGTLPRVLAALVLAVAVAGCLGTVGWGSSGVEYESHAFDHAPTAGPAVEGGILVPEDDDGGERHHVALLTSADRFDRDLLEAESASAFVDETDFEQSYLVVFQAFPASSQPDYRVERVELADSDLEVQVDDSSGGGTDDVTVETVLVRVDRGGEPLPERVTVITDEGLRFSTGRIEGAR